jgi:hypothetical protein
MTTKLLSVTTMLLMLACFAAAADVSGKWLFEQPGRGGDPVKVTMTLKADGAKLTGNVVRPGPNGDMDTPISDGKVDGNNISFKTVLNFGGNEFTISYSGALSGDDLKLKIMRPGFNGGDATTTESTAKRAK